MMDITRPHTAVINVQIEVHALDDKGQCSGQVLNSQTLAASGLRSCYLFKVDGIDAADCLEKLKEKLKALYE
jgi:hypothetical protein